MGFNIICPVLYGITFNTWVADFVSFNLNPEQNYKAWWIKNPLVLDYSNYVL